MNKAGQDVLVRSSDNNPGTGWKVKKNFMMDITKGTTSAQPITLAASTLDGKNALTLNGTMEVSLKPQLSKGKKEVLVLGTSGESLTTMHLHSQTKVRETSHYNYWVELRHHCLKIQIPLPSLQIGSDGRCCFLMLPKAGKGEREKYKIFSCSSAKKEQVSREFCLGL